MCIDGTLRFAEKREKETEAFISSYSAVCLTRRRREMTLRASVRRRSPKSGHWRYAEFQSVCAPSRSPPFAAFSNKLSNSARVFALQGHWRLQRQPLIAHMHLAKSFAVHAEALIHFSIAANLYCGRPLCFAPFKFINMVHFVQHVAPRQGENEEYWKSGFAYERCRRSFIIFIHFANIRKDSERSLHQFCSLFGTVRSEKRFLNQSLGAAKELRDDALLTLLK